MDDSRSESGDDPTSVRLRRAVDGDLDCLEWLVHRFTPLLLAQAHQRMGAALRARITELDVCHEVWAIALPRLDELVTRVGRATPVVVKFLSTVCGLRIRSHASAMQRDRERVEHLGRDALDRLPAEQTGVVARIAQAELFERVRTAMDSLSPEDREVLVLRILEQRSGAEVARRMNLLPNAVYVRQHRALAALRGVLEAELFEELERATRPPDGGVTGGG